MKVDFLEESGGQEVRLEILPLIDVIFCILTFFILAAVGLTRQQAINLDLPTAATGEPLAGQGEGGLQERLLVSVDAIGQVYLDQQPVDSNLLLDVLQQHQQLFPNGLVVLYAARDARYEDVVAVLDLVRSVPGTQVALATLPETQVAPEPEGSAGDIPADPLLDPFGIPMDPQPGLGGQPLPAPGQTPMDPFAPAPLPTIPDGGPQ